MRKLRKKGPNYSLYGFRNATTFWFYISSLAVAYPVILFVLIPQIKDYSNYIAHVERSVFLLGNFLSLVASGSTAALFAEPLWYAILAILNLVVTPPVVVGIIVGISLPMLSLGISRINKKPWLTLLLIFLLYPLATKYFMQFRQGFAIAIYLWAYSSKAKYAFILKLFAPMIHVSMFLIIAVEVMYNIFRYLKLSKRLLITFSSAIAVLTVVLIPFLVELAEAQGFVSQVYQLEEPSVSGAGAMLWSMYGIVYFLLSRPTKEMALGLTGVLVFVFSQFYIDISSRLIPVFLPFIIASFYSINARRQMLIAITIALGLVLWLPTILDPGQVFVSM